MIVHGFDPGVSTGYIRYDTKAKKIVTHNIFTTYLEIYNVLVNCSKSDVVIYEINVGKSITSSQNTMVNKVGFIEGLCECFNLKHSPQTPSVRKGYLTKAKEFMKKNCTHYECHNVDAFSHILRYIGKNKL